MRAAEGDIPGIERGRRRRLHGLHRHVRRESRTRRTIASAVANKTTFFISIPITSSKTQSDPGSPPGRYDLTAKFRNLRQSGWRDVNREAKNTGICRLFRRSDDSTEGCQPVLLLDHIICIPKCTGRPGLVRDPAVPCCPRHESDCSRTRPSPRAVAPMQKGRSITAAAFLLSIVVVGSAAGLRPDRWSLTLSFGRRRVRRRRRHRPACLGGGLGSRSCRR